MSTKLTKEQWIEILCDTEITKDENIELFRAIYSHKGHRAFHKQLKGLSKDPRMPTDVYADRITSKYSRKYNIELVSEGVRGKGQWWLFFDGGFENGAWIWALKPELIVAMKELGWTDKTKVEIFPSELTVEQFKAILTDPEITHPDDLLVLETLYSFEGHQGQLKDVIEFHQNPSLRAFNNMLMVKRIAKRFDIHLEERKKRKYKYFSVLFDGENVKHGYKWILKPELITAMEELGWTGEQYRKTASFFPEELLDQASRSYPEGMKKQITVNAYERNPQARQKCLDYWGYQCLVCEFDFEEFYGSLGRDYIHVHHLTPISKIGESYQIDPMNDLRPVCPNCHAMLHREATLTIEQLQEIIQQAHR